MKKHLHLLRVAYENWFYEDRFGDLIDILAKYDTGITRIALFSSAVHSPLTIEETRRRAAVMKERMKALRLFGYSAGINILATIGHHAEDIGNSINGPYRTMVNCKGEKAECVFCMNDEKYRKEYIAVIYRIFAEAEPDFIWIDDDIRLAHWPIGYGCFCDKCIDIFNSENGLSYTREDLCEKLENGDIKLCRLWLDHNSSGICRVFETAARAVRDVNSGITLGFMTGERYTEGYDFSRWADVLSEHGKYEIMWRPGGGAYTDRVIDELVEKSEQEGRQNAYLPFYVKESLSEIENFPYNLIKKSPTSTVFEAALSMTVGCTGAAFNVLPSETLEPIGMIEPHLSAIAEWKHFFEILQKETSGKRPVGIHTGWRPDSQASVPFITGDGGKYGVFAREMFSFGLPECYRDDCADVYMITGQAAAVMSDKEIKKMLSAGVYLDTEALELLTQRGFAEYLGFQKGIEIPADAREMYLDIDFNDGISGGIRNCRQVFNKGDSFSAIPKSEKCVVLSSITDYHGNTLADCCTGLFENALGGRICIGGYYPFSWVSDYRKTVQLKRIFSWLSKDALPSRVENYLRIRNITLKGDTGCCVTLFNPTNDIQRDVKVWVHTDKKKAGMTAVFEDTKEIISSGSADGYELFEIPEIIPYGGVILVL